MQGRDRCLDLEGADLGPAQGVGDQGGALPDQLPVPRAPVLLGERHQGAVGPGPGGTAGVGEQHEREQSSDLAVLGQQPAHLAGETDGFAGQVDPVRVGP
jgi:hypothetical protein